MGIIKHLRSTTNCSQSADSPSYATIAVNNIGLILFYQFSSFPSWFQYFGNTYRAFHPYLFYCTKIWCKSFFFISMRTDQNTFKFCPVKVLDKLFDIYGNTARIRLGNKHYLDAVCHVIPVPSRCSPYTSRERLLPACS